MTLALVNWDQGDAVTPPRLELLQSGERVTKPGEVPFRTPAEELGVVIAEHFDKVKSELSYLEFQRDLAYAAFKMLADRKAELEAENKELRRELDLADSRGGRDGL